MKKLISIILAAVMILSFAACGQKETAPAVGDIVTDMEVSFGEGLPSQVLRGDYKIAEIPQEYAEKYGMFAFYVPAEGNDSFELGLYRKPKNGMTLEDKLNSLIELNGVQEQEPIIWDYDRFNEAGDSHFGYTAFFVPADDNGNPYFARYFAFESGDDIVIAEYYNAPKTVEFTNPNFKQIIPNGMVEQPLTDYDKSYGAVAKYDYVLKGEMPTITIYENKLEESDIKDVAKKLSSAFDTTVEYYYESKTADGKSLPCVYLKFFDTIDGVDYMEESLVTIIDDTVVNMEFRSPAGEDRDAVYVQTAAPMLIWGSGSFNK